MLQRNRSSTKSRFISTDRFSLTWLIACRPGLTFNYPQHRYILFSFNHGEWSKILRGPGSLYLVKVSGRCIWLGRPWGCLFPTFSSVFHTLWFLIVSYLFADTMGYAFAFNTVTFLAGVKVGGYVHYPTISTDMLARVKSRKLGHTNSDAISSSTVLSSGKLL